MLFAKLYPLLQPCTMPLRHHRQPMTFSSSHSSAAYFSTKIANFPHLRKFFPAKYQNHSPTKLKFLFGDGLGEGLPEVVGRNGGGDVDLLAADGMHKLNAMALQRDTAVGVAALRSVFKVAFDWATDG